MILTLSAVLSPDQVAEARRLLDGAEWTDGRTTAGPQAGKVKDNLQLPVDSAVARQLGTAILQALTVHPRFMSAALPLHFLPPMFNRYAGGQQFGTHVDGAIRQVPGSGHRLRTDLSCTLFFSEPDEYDGGVLIIEDTYGSKSVKLAAGDLVLYPATSLHQVTPVTRGARVCSFFWLQSLVRDDQRRAMLYDMDMAIQRLTGDVPDHPSLVSLTGVYHNLLRQWAEM